jgi:nucleotide-binding universal stress UspA family protein
MREYRRILALVDLDDAHAPAARRALSLARLGRAELAFLHLIEPDPSLDGGYPPPSRAELRQGFEQAGQRRLDFLAATLGAGEAECLVRYGQPATCFAETLARWQPDLVVAATDYGFLAGRHDTLILGDRPVRSGGLAALAWRFVAALRGMPA